MIRELFEFQVIQWKMGRRNLLPPHFLYQPLPIHVLVFLCRIVTPPRRFPFHYGSTHLLVGYPLVTFWSN